MKKIMKQSSLNKRVFKSGFTLPEILVVALIASLLSLVLFTVFRSNLTTMAWGQKHMDFNYKIQYMMKQFYTDVKTVNPAISFGKYGDLYISGERTGEFFPQHVIIERKPSEGTEKIFLPISSIYSDGNAYTISYEYSKKHSTLHRKITGPGRNTQRILAYNVKDLVFSKSEEDPMSVKLVCRIGDDKREEVFEDIDFTVRLESELVAIRVVNL